MKCLCKTPKLRAYNPVNLDYIFHFVNEKWVVSDPQINSFFHANKYPFMIDCLSCRESWQQDKLEPQYSASVHHKEVVLDLDQTLFSTESAWEEPDADLTMKGPKLSYTYYVFKRPGLDNFIKELEKRFDKINFFTAAQPWYGQRLVESLNISPDKMGYLKTSVDTHTARPLSFEWEAMKKMEDSFVIDDKHLVIDGFNNTVLKIKPYHYRNQNDKVLDEVLLLLDKKQVEFKKPEKISGFVDIFLRSIEINLTDLPWEKHHEILNHKPVAQEDINKRPIRTRAHENHFLFENNNAEFYISDLAYPEYVSLFEAIKEYTDHSLMTEIEYEEYLKKRNRPFNNNF